MLDLKSRDETQFVSANVFRLASLAVYTCVCAILVIGITALWGWHVRNEALTAVIPRHVTMKANTAICFIVSGLGVLFALRPGRLQRILSRLAAVAVLAVAAMTMLEFLTGVDFHIDQLLFQDPRQWPYPGRMATVTTVEFCLAGIALLLVLNPGIARRLGQILAAVFGAVAFAGIIGYFYGVPILYGAIGRNTMAFNTGVAFLLLGFAMLLVSPRSVLVEILSGPERGSWLARRLFFALLIGPVLLGRFYLLRSVSFGSPAFGMALLAVTIVLAGVVTLLVATTSLNRNERRVAELDSLREISAQEAKHSERELRLITDRLPILLSYIDIEGRFLRVNRTYEEWLGRTAKDIVGKSVKELLGMPYWEDTLAAREATRRGESYTFDALYPTLSGDRHVQVTYAPDLQEGHLRGLACLVLDIHDRFLAEQALRQSEKLAAVGRLASSIAHEMNNPLEAVTNLLYLAALDLDTQERACSGEAKHFLEQAQTELTRATHIVTQTLRFHRQASGATSCIISVLADQVLALYQGRLAQKDIAVERRFRDTTPLLCRDGEVRQVLANLVANAIDAMVDGGRLLIRSRNVARQGGGFTGVVVTLADTGHGIDQKTQSSLFEPFHTTKGSTGSGLGLWISKEIVDRHHGRILMRSSQRKGGSGTVFQVWLGNDRDQQANDGTG